MDTKKIVSDYWKYCYLKSFNVKIQIYVIRFGAHICNSGDPEENDNNGISN